MSISLIQSYFPELSPKQIEQFDALGDVYSDWNSKVNLISRKDVEHLYERHILHSLAIAKAIRFTPGTEVLDVGTGGGFPGIPLAILLPEVKFTLIDSMAKKIKVVDFVGKAIELENMVAEHARAGEFKGQFDFVTSRAVAPLNKFIPWLRKNIKTEMQNGMPNGLFALKGGDLTEEMASIPNHCDEFKLSDFFKEEFFETKKLIYVNLTPKEIRSKKSNRKKV